MWAWTSRFHIEHRVFFLQVFYTLNVATLIASLFLVFQPGQFNVLFLVSFRLPSKELVNRLGLGREVLCQAFANVFGSSDIYGLSAPFNGIDTRHTRRGSKCPWQRCIQQPSASLQRLFLQQIYAFTLTFKFTSLLTQRFYSLSFIKLPLGMCLMIG